MKALLSVLMVFASVSFAQETPRAICDVKSVFSEIDGIAGSVSFRTGGFKRQLTPDVLKTSTLTTSETLGWILNDKSNIFVDLKLTVEKDQSTKLLVTMRGSKLGSLGTDTQSGSLADGAERFNMYVGFGPDKAKEIGMPVFKGSDLAQRDTKPDADYLWMGVRVDCYVTNEPLPRN